MLNGCLSAGKNRNKISLGYWQSLCTFVSDNQEIEEDNANISRVGQDNWYLMFHTLVISYQLVFRTLAQVNLESTHIGNTYLIHVSQKYVCKSTSQILSCLQNCNITCLGVKQDSVRNGNLPLYDLDLVHTS